MQLKFIDALRDHLYWQQFKIAVLVLPVLGGALIAFPRSYLSLSNFVLGIILLPLVFVITGKSRLNLFYGILLVLLLLLAVTFQVKIFYFLALCFFLLFSFEAIVGRINTIALFLMGAMSPVFLQVAVILGFPIRMKLSEWSGELLRLAGLNISVQGNSMSLSGSEFTVDAACMGLNMLAISMLMTVFVIIMQFRKQRKVLSFFHLSILFFATLCLNIISNLFRILILVLFKIGPEHPMHELIGLLGLVAYVLVPIYFISKFLVGRKGEALPLNKSTVNGPNRMRFLILGILAMAIVGSAFRLRKDREAMTEHQQVSVVGMLEEKMPKGISKFSNSEILVYIKPIQEFFSGEHTPLLCWLGSGYEFKKIANASIAGKSIYAGLLVKGEDQLHTAWWYTDGEINTIDQFEWRGRMMKNGKRFCLINVTAKDELTLMSKVKKLIEGDLILRE